MKLSRIALAAGVFVAALLGAEGVARWTASPVFSSAEVREEARRVVARMRGGEWAPGLDDPQQTQPAGAVDPDQYPEHLLHPYVGFDIGAADDLATSEAASFVGENAAERVDVLVLGGSVAAGFAKDCHRSLKRALEAAPQWAGRKVRVLNGGRGGFRQPQLVHLLTYLHAVGYRPDVVLEIDGFNEVALGLANSREGVHPVMPSISHWEHLASNAPLTEAALQALGDARRAQIDGERALERADRWGLFHSALLARGVTAQVSAAYARFADASQRFEATRTGERMRSFLVGPKFEGDDAHALRLAVDVWFDSSIALDSLCRTWGIRYLQVLQPTLHDEGAKPVTPTELRRGAEPAIWAQGAREGYPLLRERGAELAARGLEFLDLSRAFATQTGELYYDVCHFVPAGNELLVEPIAAALSAQPPPRAR